MAEMAARSRLLCVKFCLLLTLVASVRVQGADDQERPRIGLQRSNEGAEPGGEKSPQAQGKMTMSPRLAEENACADSIRKYCRNANPSTLNNLAALDCLHNNVPVIVQFVLYAYSVLAFVRIISEWQRL